MKYFKPRLGIRAGEMRSNWKWFFAIDPWRGVSETARFHKMLGPRRHEKIAALANPIQSLGEWRWFLTRSAAPLDVWDPCDCAACREKGAVS